MSSIRSRNGGKWISNVLIRYIKSCRNSPSATILFRSRCVAQTILTSTLKRLVVADAANFAAFEHPQQCRLRRFGKFTDFIEEQCSAVGDFEQSLSVIVGTRECAFAMSEQFAFDQIFRQCPAVDCDKWFVCAVALIDGRPGPPVLCRSRFRQDTMTVDCVGATFSISALTRCMLR